MINAFGWILSRCSGSAIKEKDKSIYETVKSCDDIDEIIDSCMFNTFWRNIISLQLFSDIKAKKMEKSYV